MFVFCRGQYIFVCWPFLVEDVVFWYHYNMRKILKNLFQISVFGLFLFVFCGFLLLPVDCGGFGTGGVYKSTDMGESWAHKVKLGENSTIAGVNVLDVAIDPLNRNIIYLGTRTSGIYKSIDAGETWEKLVDENGVLSSRANVYQITIDPANTNRMYAGIYQSSRGRLVKSENGGKNWEEVYVVSEKKYAVFTVVIDPKDTSNIYMGTAQGGFLKSADYGVTWKSLKWFPNVVINKIIINPYDSRILYASTYKNGIYKSVDRGASWISFEEALKKYDYANQVESLALDYRNPNILYTSSRYGVLRSVNGGEEWEPLDLIFPEKSLLISSVAVDPNNSDVLYCGDGSYFYKSEDRGKTWKMIKVPTGKKIIDIEINPDNSEEIYLGVHK